MPSTRRTIFLPVLRLRRGCVQPCSVSCQDARPSSRPSASSPGRPSVGLAHDRFVQKVEQQRGVGVTISARSVTLGKSRQGAHGLGFLPPNSWFPLSMDHKCKHTKCPSSGSCTRSSDSRVSISVGANDVLGRWNTVHDPGMNGREHEAFTQVAAIMIESARVQSSPVATPRNGLIEKTPPESRNVAARKGRIAPTMHSWSPAAASSLVLFDHHQPVPLEGSCRNVICTDHTQGSSSCLRLACSPFHVAQCRLRASRIAEALAPSGHGRKFFAFRLMSFIIYFSLVLVWKG